LPDAADLPGDLARLPLMQAKALRLEPVEWSEDVRTLSEVFVELGFVREPVPTQPEPSAKIRKTPLLTPGELADALRELDEWEEWGDSLTLEYPRVRQELRRTFTFATFLQAIAFMHFVAPRLEEKAHHPRWSNEWNVVRVRLTTWDVGNRITMLDVETARIVDAAYDEFKARSRR
jgi:4a-hydroxytetrahydrobiopterin dehydratase